MFGIWRHWRKISTDRAVALPYFGFGGWMWFFYALAVVRILLAFRNIFGNEMALGKMYEVPNIGTIRIELLLRVMLLIPFLILAPLRHPLMPQITIASLWMSTLLAVLFGLIMSLPGDRLFSVFLVEATIAAAYTLYLLHSKRVNVTYLSLVAT